MHEGRVSNDPLHRWALDEDFEVKSRNRYANVQAWANSRIRLRVPEGACDYTNASPIVLEDTVTLAERRYIASQVSVIYLLFQVVEGSCLMNSSVPYRVRKRDISPTSGTWSSTKAAKLPSSSCSRRRSS